MNIFDFVNAINSPKKPNLIEESLDKEYTEKQYNAFVVNRTFSYFPDTILYSNLLNRHNYLDNKLQFDYLLNSLRPGKRFSKWVKKFDNNDLELVKIYYGYSTEKAKQVLHLLSKEQLEQIKKHLEQDEVEYVESQRISRGRAN